MSTEITQITVGRTRVGIVGLRFVFEEVRQLGLEDESRCKEELVRRVKRQNYIPARAEGEYAQALWREYRRWRGGKVEEEVTAGLVIKVLGPGCYACDKLMEDVRAVLSEMGLAADLEHVRDPQQIGQYGMVGVPALVINNKVKLSGRLPSKRQLQELLAAAVK